MGVSKERKTTTGEQGNNRKMESYDAGRNCSWRAKGNKEISKIFR